MARRDFEEVNRIAIMEETPKTIDISLPFLKTNFPEMAHLSVEEQESILKSCIESDTIAAISRKHLLLLRGGWAIWFSLMALFLVLMWSEVIDPRPLAFAIPISFVVAIAWLPITHLVHHAVSSRELHRLVQREVDKLSDSPNSSS